MLNAYEQRLIAFYLANAAAALHHRDRETSDLADWIADRENRTAFGGRKRRLTVSRSHPSSCSTRSGSTSVHYARSIPPRISDTQR